MKELTREEIERLKTRPILEKIKNGDWYQFGKESELQAIVRQSSQTVQKINDLAKSDFDAAKTLLHQFVPGLTESTEIYFPLTSIEYPDQLTIGADSFINAGLQIISAGKVTVGTHTFIGPNCQLFTANHSLNKDLRREGWQYDAPITIGNDCWLGGSVIVLPGVTIADDVVVGAGSVITHDIPAHSLVAGNPARVIRSTENSIISNVKSQKV
jgi:maltose O-acetyltransferase